MKRVSLILVPVLAACLAACQQKGVAPAVAVASPSPAATAVAPAEAAAPAPAEAGPAAAGPARAAAPAERPAAAPRRAGEPLPPAGPAVATTDPAPIAAPVSVPPPAPTPEPTPPPVVLAAGTVLPVELREAITTKTAQPEDRVVAVVHENVSVGGKVVIPAGSEVLGSVVTAERSGRVKGKAHLVVSFHQVRVGHRTYTISATGFDVVAGSSKGKDAKIAGGAAAAGVVIGAIAGGGSGAAKGGLIGGAAGGAAVLATRGKEVELPAGSRYHLTLRKALTLE